MAPLLTALLSALVPVGVEGVKQAINKWTGGPKAFTVDEQIKIDQNEVAKLEALAKLDNPYGTPSQWVIDLRAAARYIAAFAVIVGGLVAMFSPLPLEVKAVALEAVSVSFGFLFGTRILVNLKR